MKLYYSHQKALQSKLNISFKLRFLIPYLYIWSCCCIILLALFIIQIQLFNTQSTVLNFPSIFDTYAYRTALKKNCIETIELYVNLY